MSSSLFHIMNIGGEALANARVGVDVTGHNIANAHTEGFSRQRVMLATREPVKYGMNVLGNGARVETIERVHDQYLEGYLRKELQGNGSATALSKGMGRIEELFNPELTATVRQRLTSFQNATQELSNYPEEPAVRTNLVESANGLTQSFNVAHASITQIQRDVTVEINQEIQSTNQKLGTIASLNQQIKEMSAGGGQANDLLDKRDALIKGLANTIDIQTYNDKNNNLIIRGPKGALLIEGSRYGELITSDPSGMQTHSKILFKSDKNAPVEDLTSGLQSGRLAGMLKVRDDHAQNTRNELNRMATTFASSFNQIHREGFGIGSYASSTGRDLFAGIDEEDPAGQIRVSDMVLSDPDAISAALTAESPGDNIVANEFVRLFDNPMFDQGTVAIGDYYDRMVSRVGIESMRSKEDLSASNVLLSQLQGQREAVAGVSLDEEAADLLKYQHLFAASSRVIRTVDEMFETILGLKR